MLHRAIDLMMGVVVLSPIDDNCPAVVVLLCMKQCAKEKQEIKKTIFIYSAHSNLNTEQTIFNFIRQ